MCALFNKRVWDYKSGLEGCRYPLVLVIFALSVLLSGALLWAIIFIVHPTARTLLRAFVGLCLAAVLAYLVLASGFPTSLLV